MKSFLKVLMLIVSITVAGCLIWNANRNKKVDESAKEKTVAPQSGNSKEKNGRIQTPGIPSDVDPSVSNIVTRKPDVSKDSLFSSSKRIDAILDKKQLKEIIEGEEKSKEAKPTPPREEE